MSTTVPQPAELRARIVAEYHRWPKGEESPDSALDSLIGFVAVRAITFDNLRPSQQEQVDVILEPVMKRAKERCEAVIFEELGQAADEAIKALSGDDR